MVIGYFLVLCIIAAVNVVILSRLNNGLRGPYSAMFFMGFIACAGHFFLAMSTDLNEAIVANKMIYLATVFMPMFLFYAVLSVCDTKFPVIGRFFLGSLAFVVFALSATVGYSDIYYSSVTYVKTYGVGNYEATFGPAHMLFNFMLVGYVVVNICLIVHAFLKKKNVSFKCLIALSLIEAASILSFLVARVMGTDTLIMPAVYVFDQFALLYICFRVRYYDITQSVMATLEENNVDGYVSVFSNSRFLGANRIAYENFVELQESRVDKSLPSSTELGSFLLSWVQEYMNGSPTKTKTFERDDKHYKVFIKTLHVHRNRETTFLFKFEDDSDVHNYVEMLGSNNQRLAMLAKSNADQITAIQEQMIVGMANMVESRDNNTGGHIKRTSRVVSILVEELRREKKVEYSDAFYEVLIKSAPMHDLGKIAIDDQILRKPGRYTPEEYEVMKTHSEKGAMIVENLLAQVEDEWFVRIAKNVAWYHHERFDGCGYPKGLKGEEIPFEARVMAVADVYDALVSKRCYKEKFSCDDAFDIIAKGMGSQFDPSLWECFLNSRGKLEEYYKNC